MNKTLLRLTAIIGLLSIATILTSGNQVRSVEHGQAVLSREKPIQDTGQSESNAGTDLPPPSPDPLQSQPQSQAPPPASSVSPPSSSGSFQSQPQSQASPSIPSSSPPSASHPLQGRIEHSERLDPVAPQLQAGAVFNEQLLPLPEPNNEWYWIPEWYAGLKHVDTETVWQDYDFRSGNTIRPDRVILNRQDLAIGFQPDRNGQIWEFKRAPYRTTIEGENTSSVLMVRNRDPLEVSADRVVIRLVQTTLTTDRSSQRILKTEQMEQLNTFVPSGPGLMNLQSSIKSFGPDGSPLVQELSSKIVVNRAPFQPIDSYEGRDMRRLFQQFMLSHGYGNLLPDYLRVSRGHIQGCPRNPERKDDARERLN